MGKYSVQRYSKSVVVADGATVGTADTVSLNGILIGVFVNVPQLSGTTTITLAITDADAYTLFSRATIAENAKTVFFIDANNHPIRVPLSGVLTLTVTQTNAQSGALSTIPVVLLIER